MSEQDWCYVLYVLIYNWHSGFLKLFLETLIAHITTIEMMKPVSLFIGICMLTACDSISRQVTDSVVEVDLSAAQPQFTIEKIVPLETTAEAFYDRFFKIDIDQEHVFVQDRTRILVFDAGGKYLSRVERLGKGPQEYTYLINFCPFKDELYIIRGDTKTIGVYAYDGRFIRSISLDFQPLDICVTDDYMAFQVASTEANSLIVTDREGKRLYEAVPPVQAQNTFEMAAFHPFVRSGNLVFFQPNYISEVYRIEKDKGENQSFLFDFGPHTLTADYVSKIMSPNDFKTKLQQDEKISYLNFQPAENWWNLNFYLGDMQYGWFYHPVSKKQYSVSKRDNPVAGRTVSATVGDCFVTAVEAWEFIEDPIYASWREGMRVEENDNAVLIYYTIKE